MSYLPFNPDHGIRPPRCVSCEAMLDGEATVEGHDTCTRCRAKERLGKRSAAAERQQRIEEALG